MHNSFFFIEALKFLRIQTKNALTNRSKNNSTKKPQEEKSFIVMGNGKHVVAA